MLTRLITPSLLKVGLGPRLEAERIHRELEHLVGLMPPFDLLSVCGHFGLEVDAYPFRSDINGALVCVDDRHYIVVNRLHRRERRRWSAAHELAHYLVHRHRLTPIVCSEAPPHDMVEMEIEANAFAAELLMPPAWVSSWWSRTGHVARCAEPFGVSVTAMRLRLEELRLVRRRR